MNWRKKRVLVTGAGGFIGSHLVEKLVRLGADVTGFVRYNSRGELGLIEQLPIQIKERLKTVSGDLKDTYAVKETVKDKDIIFHLGAVISIPYSYIHPQEVIETNILGTLNVLNAAREFKVEKIVHTSTSEVYGTGKYIPISEEHPLQAQSPYSASKIAADKIAESFFRTYNLPIAIIRPFNTYGPRQSARAVIPTIIIQALTRNEIFIGATHPTRDFTYIEDTVEGFLKIAETSESIGEIINIGSGIEVSIKEITNKIISVINRDVKVVFDATRIRPIQSEVEKLVADNSKAKKIINWEPKISLDEGLKFTIDWLSNSLTLYKPDIYNI